MFGLRFKKNKNDTTEKTNQGNEKIRDDALTTSLEKNMNLLTELFRDNDLFITRNIRANQEKRRTYCIVYSEGMVENAIINENIIEPLTQKAFPDGKGNLADALIQEILQINEAEKTKSISQLVEAVTYGDTILLAEGMAEVIILNTKNFALRAVAEPDAEKILSGPREGFTESIIINLSMVRRKIRTNELKMKFLKFGKRTNTNACVCYLEGIVNQEVLNELYERLNQINMDSLLDTNYITEMIKDSSISPFRTTGSTERPDVVVGKILEGRIAIFLDGTPVVLTVPYLFVENFQSSEDYYLNYFYTSFSRLLRILGFFLTITVPGFYVAIVAYHHEILPTSLLINIAGERQSVPLPAALEAFIMLIVFDILRETGIRMPSNVGQALSIVGAIVIGQAAVEAKLVASPMIIVVALTGITSLLIPKMNAPIIFARLLLLLAASILGLYGFTLGLSALVIHILNLRTFGISQVNMTGKLRFQDMKDLAIRAPWQSMLLRPPVIANDLKRMDVHDKTP